MCASMAFSRKTTRQVSSDAALFVPPVPERRVSRHEGVAALVASVVLFVGATYAWSAQATVNAGNKITVSTTKANDAAKSGDSADVDSSATASDAPGEANKDETSSSDSGVSSDAQSSTSTEQGQGKESSDESANEGVTP